MAFSKLLVIYTIVPFVFFILLENISGAAVPMPVAEPRHLENPDQNNISSVLSQPQNGTANILSDVLIQNNSKTGVSETDHTITHKHKRGERCLSAWFSWEWGNPGPYPYPVYDYPVYDPYFDPYGPYGPYKRRSVESKSNK